jgi:hypothetical protein
MIRRILVAGGIAAALSVATMTGSIANAATHPVRSTRQAAHVTGTHATSVAAVIPSQSPTATPDGPPWG